MTHQNTQGTVLGRGLPLPDRRRVYSVGIENVGALEQRCLPDLSQETQIESHS